VSATKTVWKKIFSESFIFLSDEKKLTERAHRRRSAEKDATILVDAFGAEKTARPIAAASTPTADGVTA